MDPCGGTARGAPSLISALARVAGSELRRHGTAWLFTQGETRKTKSVQLFTEFVSRRLAAYPSLLAGPSLTCD